MSGESLKRILLQSGLTMASIAHSLEMSPQHLNQALSAADVKSGLLEKISLKLNISMSALYGEAPGFAMREAQQAIFDLTLENTRLKNRIAELEGKGAVAAS